MLSLRPFFGMRTSVGHTARTLESTAMKLPRRQFLHLAAGAAALPAVSRTAWAQAYPSRPITMVVPYSAGGPTDTIARIMAEGMRASLGQTIIVENTTGAAGNAGDRRPWRRLACQRRLSPARCRRAVRGRPISGRRSREAGPGAGPDRH